MSDTLRERLPELAAPARRVTCTYAVPAACGKPFYGDTPREVRAVRGDP